MYPTNPSPSPSTNTNPNTSTSTSTSLHWCRFYDVAPGECIDEDEDLFLSDGTLQRWGAAAAQVDHSLRGFWHPSGARKNFVGRSILPSNSADGSYSTTRANLRMCSFPFHVSGVHPPTPVDQSASIQQEVFTVKKVVK
jgi:hypothetical protein